MSREDSSDGMAGADDVEGSRSTDQVDLSNRMKQLLYGVRLSVSAASLTPAGDLEELARRLDMDRSRRHEGRNS